MFTMRQAVHPVPSNVERPRKHKHWAEHPLDNLHAKCKSEGRGLHVRDYG